MDLPRFQGFTNQNGGSVERQASHWGAKQFTVEDGAG
jgi:hypothetical protein